MMDVKSTSSTESKLNIVLWHTYELKLKKIEERLSTEEADIVLLSDIKKKELPPLKGFEAFYFKNRDNERLCGEALLVRHNLAKDVDPLPTFVDQELRYILVFDRKLWMAFGVLSIEPRRLHHLVRCLGVCGVPFIVGVCVHGIEVTPLIEQFFELLRHHGLHPIFMNCFNEGNSVVFNSFISNVNYRNPPPLKLADSSNPPLLLQLDYQAFILQYRRMVQENDKESTRYPFRKRGRKKSAIEIKQSPTQAQAQPSSLPLAGPKLSIDEICHRHNSSLTFSFEASKQDSLDHA